MSVAAIRSSDAAAAIRSRSKRAPAIIPRRRVERQLERVDRVEQVLLVLLQVLVVGQRQRVHARRAAPPGGRPIRGAFARSSSAASGFFFCGMIDEPDDHASGSSKKPNSCDRPQHELGAEAREVRRADRGGAEVVEDEVAVGDRVDRVRRDAVEAELVGDHAAVGVEVHAGQRARAERQRAGLRARRSGSARGRAASIQKYASRWWAR